VTARKPTPDPADEVAPVASARVPPPEGGPGPAAAGPGGSTSPHDHGQATAGTPVPGSGARVEPAPGRGRAQDPAGGALASPVREAISVPPAGSTDEDRATQRKDWRAALSAHSAAKRRGRFTRAAKQAGPGMIRRAAPETPGDGAA